jgi:hypothetical protein
MNWLSDQVIGAAQAVEAAGGTVRHFRQVVAERFSEMPVTDWEILFWTRGVKRGLITLNSHWFRLGSGRQTSVGLFVRNEAGLIVGLRREAITQAAVYAALVTHYGYQWLLRVMRPRLTPRVQNKISQSVTGISENRSATTCRKWRTVPPAASTAWAAPIT